MIKEQNTILKTKWRSTVFTLLLFFGLSSGLSAQNITVTGTVSSSDGETVPMASVVVQGTSKAVVSDALGKYSIDVSKDATLIFSGTGFISQVVPVANRPLIDVVLNPDNELLDEVVVVVVPLS